MTDALIERLRAELGVDAVLVGDAISTDLMVDETLRATPVAPACVAYPSTTAEVSAIVRLAADVGAPVTARGAGTGLSGACIPRSNGVLVAFDRMRALVELDTENQVAVVQPGLTLAELDAATAAVGLVYPVFLSLIHI